MKKRITIDGGAVVYEIEHPVRQRGDSDKVRAAKSKATDAAQRLRNQILSTRELELRLAKNYPTPGSGLVCVLSYDEAHLPRNRKEAQRRFKYFLKKLRAARKTAGLPEPRVIYAPEALSSASGRWHHHIVVDNTGDDFDMIRAAWIYGSDVEIEKIRVDEEKNHETLARYMSKELREAQEYDCKPGLHGWGCTRNCLKPEVDVRIVDDRAQLRAPKGATVLIHERHATEYAEHAVLKYRLPARCFRGISRARRRRH